MARFITSAIWPDKHKEILREMHSKGATILEIATKLGRTKNSIIGFIHRSGLSNNRPKNIPIKAKKPEFVVKEKPKQIFVKPIIEIERPKSTDGVLFVYTKNRQCKWIDNEPCGLETRVCGKLTATGKSWCPEHHALVYNKQPVLNMRGQLHG